MRFSVVLAILLIIVPVPIRSDSVQPHNGIWWSGLDVTEKTWFIAGYVEAIDRADFLVEQAITFKKLQVIDSTKDVTPYLKFYNITYGQFREGLDAFYGDYRNKQINFNVAILYIRDQIQGVPQKDLDVRVEHMRQATTRADYDEH
jgi:hypothetical protein